jgi:hypothetical protein
MKEIGNEMFRSRGEKDREIALWPKRRRRQSDLRSCARTTFHGVEAMDGTSGKVTTLDLMPISERTVN